MSQAEARSLAETYGGKLASEFNSKTSHVIMATGKRKLFFLYKLCEKVKIEVTLLTVPTVAYVEELAVTFSDRLYSFAYLLSCFSKYCLNFSSGEAFKAIVRLKEFNE